MADKDYTINPQRYTSSRARNDEAANPLFVQVSREALARPTFAAFMQLLDNYEAKGGVTESVSSKETSENAAFLNAALKTPVMKYTYNYLKSKGKVSSESDFKKKTE